MEVISEDKILKHRPRALEEVRCSVELDTPERVNEAVDILEEWTKKQAHFVTNAFSRDYLERTLIMAKGLVERAKQRIEKLCTFKTLMPEYFVVSPDIKAEFLKLGDFMPNVLLPRCTEDHYRIGILRVISNDYNANDVFIFYKYAVMVAEYMKKNDYMVGALLIGDIRQCNIANFIAHVNPVFFRQFFNLLLDGYGLRLKGIYLVSESKMVGAIVSLLKQVLSAKVGSRIHVVPDVESVYNFVPRELLPADYGGDEKHLKVLPIFGSGP